MLTDTSHRIRSVTVCFSKAIVEFSEVNLVLMLGEFHMEMASLKWLSGSGWKEVMCNAGVATQEEAESFLSPTM